jgi:putative FmdB family regulatory protein
MPFYEYVCEACGKDFVLLQSMTSKAEDTACPYCSEKKAKKMLSKFASAGSGEHSSCSIGGSSWGGG